MKLGGLDTLFLRLFALMWVTLVASHLVAYALAIPLASPEMNETPADRLKLDRLPTLPSLPPTDLGGAPPGHPAGPQEGPPGGPPGGPPAAPPNGPVNAPPGGPPGGSPAGLPSPALW